MGLTWTIAFSIFSLPIGERFYYVKTKSEELRKRWVHVKFDEEQFGARGKGQEARGKRQGARGKRQGARGKRQRARGPREARNG